jgi:predicted anti-sigma-YlaC factor YlaD
VIHCTMEDLLALKDGEGTAWARKHLAECDVCRREFDGQHQRVAQLRALPNLNPPRDRWPAVRATFLAERRKNRMKKVRWGSLALAASLAGIMTVQVVNKQNTTVAEVQNLEQLRSRSQQLEDQLRAYDPANRVMSGATAGAVAALEDRIAAVDQELDRPQMPRDNLVGLWRQRVQLMQGLVNVHAARATYSGM